MSYSRTRCTTYDRISKKALLANLGESYDWLADMPEDEWSITSFDARSRNVCFRIDNQSTKVYLNVVIPYPSTSGLK